MGANPAGKKALLSVTNGPGAPHSEVGRETRCGRRVPGDPRRITPLGQRGKAPTPHFPYPQAGPERGGRWAGQSGTSSCRGSQSGGRGSVSPGHPDHRGGPLAAPLARPRPPTHRRVQQSQQVLLIRVQESDRRPAGPPNQVGAQSQAEQSQQPHPQGGQQAWVLWGEQAA